MIWRHGNYAELQPAERGALESGQLSPARGLLAIAGILLGGVQKSRQQPRIDPKSKIYNRLQEFRRIRDLK